MQTGKSHLGWMLMRCQPNEDDSSPQTTSCQPRTWGAGSLISQRVPSKGQLKDILQETQLAWQHPVAAALHLWPISRQQRGPLRLQDSVQRVLQVMWPTPSVLHWSDFWTLISSFLLFYNVSLFCRELFQDVIFHQHLRWKDADSMVTAVSNN